MKTTLQITFLTLGLLVSLKSSADPFVKKSALGVGQRLYSTRNEQGEYLGAMTITSMTSDGIITVQTDKFGERRFDRLAMQNFERGINCGFKSDQFYYFTETSRDGKAIPVAFAQVKETFDSCDMGRAIVVSMNDGAPSQASLLTLQKEVTCDFQKTKVSTQSYGDGMAVKVYGNCENGIVDFRPDRRAARGTTVQISASLIEKQDTGGQARTSFFGTRR